MTSENRNCLHFLTTYCDTSIIWLVFILSLCCIWFQLVLCFNGRGVAKHCPRDFTLSRGAACALWHVFSLSKTKFNLFVVTMEKEQMLLIVLTFRSRGNEMSLTHQCSHHCNNSLQLHIVPMIGPIGIVKCEPANLYTSFF